MFKKSIAIVVGIGMFMAFAGVASAASDVTHLTVDGRSNATVDEGDSVQAKVTFDLTAGTDVESMSWELIGSGLPQTCVDVTDRISTGTFTSTFDIDTAGASEGTWDVRIRTYGVNGSGVSNLCQSSTQNDSVLFESRITVVDDIDDNQVGSGSGSSSTLSSLEQAIANLTALVASILSGSGTAGTSEACAAFNAKLAGTVPHVYNDANVRLQGFLLSEGANIPALAAGASFGYRGPQTMAAESWFKSVHNCN